MPCVSAPSTSTAVPLTSLAGAEHGKAATASTPSGRPSAARDARALRGQHVGDGEP